MSDNDYEIIFLRSKSSKVELDTAAEILFDVLVGERIIKLEKEIINNKNENNNERRIKKT